MKKSYKKLLLFQIILIFILLLNSFVSSVLETYNMVIFLLLLIFIFKFIFGLEKDRNRYVKDIIFEILIIVLIFFLIYYLSGLFIGFARTNNYYTYYGMTSFVFPIILTTILKEFLRYNILKKSEGSKFLIVCTCILFILFDLTNSVSLGNFKSAYTIFIFIATMLLPTVSNNIVCTYISYNFGYKPNILWLLVVRLYSYFLPLVPDISQYIYSVLFISFPLFIGSKVYSFLHKENISEDKDETKFSDYFVTLTAFVLVVIIVYFTSGYFKYHAITIGSGSMMPGIKIGDVVVIEKVYDNYDNLQPGQVIAYKREGVIVVHRIVKVLKDIDNKYYFYTKGDANEDVDKYSVDSESIVGIVNYKIPYIGLPTIWLKDL